MGYGTQHPHSQKEHIELYNILKFGVNQANIRRDTAIQKLKNLLRNVWNAGRVASSQRSGHRSHNCTMCYSETGDHTVFVIAQYG